MNKRQFLSLSLQSAALPVLLMANHNAFLSSAYAAPNRAAGDLDVTFGGRGFVTVPSPDNEQPLFVRMAQCAADQRIYVTGLAPTFIGEVFVSRLLDDGKVDTNFGDNGYVPIPPPPSQNQTMFEPQMIGNCSARS